MICDKCGTANNDDARFCKNCGNNLAAGQADQQTQSAQQTAQTPPPPRMEQPIQYVTPERPPKVENYLVFSILTTVLCCLPLGIAAIIKSTQVDKELAAGNYEAALLASKQAKTFNIISAVLGGIGVIIVILLNLVPLLMLGI